MNLTETGVRAFHCPRWQQLPALSLYMDQVVIVINEVLGLFAEDGESLVTPSMVNNYVKQKLVPAPEKKKYSRQQLAALIQVSVLKRVLSMQEITGLVSALTETYGLEAGYDRFCDELERDLVAVFSAKPGADIRFPLCEGAAAALNAALTALCGKLYVQNYLGGLPAAQATNGKKEGKKDK